MGKPRMIILIRHAQSEGNKNREIHQTIPDHRVKLTPEGHRQAHEAGSKLRALLRPDDTIHFFTSPYRRTRETTEGILQSLTSDSPSPSPFPRHTIKVYEEPRLREQDFGNFQPCSAEMERMWLERADYGHFFYRIPNGESAADAYDRISGFNESLWRLFGENDFASVCVLVTHGLMTRVFLMKWYHWSVEYFEDLRNINHCEFVIMKLNEDNGKYVLQNQLRTWSELRKEKELERQRDRAMNVIPPAVPTSSESLVPIRRKWGGCPDGCNHGIRRKGSTRSNRANGTDLARNTLDTQHRKAHDSIYTHNQPTQESNNGQGSSAELKPQVEGQVLTAPEPALGDSSKDARLLINTIPVHSAQYDFLDRKETAKPQSTRSDFPPNEPNSNNQESNLNTATARASPIPKRPDLSRFHRDSEDHLLHPPRSNYALLHLSGRDGGGTLSGANSVAPSEDEREDNPPKPPTHQPKPSHDLGNDGDDEGSGTQAQRLRRSRSHHTHHRHNHPTPGRRHLSKKPPNGYPDIDRNLDSDHPDSSIDHEEDPDPDYHEHNNDDDLEAARREDQSIRGSVY
ncbi:histidine phosphatase superfamily [Aspergillus flavus]|uniref:Histidine phosphatase superfamily n=2 Tax=Aspergillus subgen. Circumdati TaxID=2720871 RepID=A0A5N6H1S5_ASPFL|nr:phosphoglycerate mutase family domain protein [Aspergillus oryzae 3.042]KAB8247150.1 histidine phosphatase superfamily [Aspergillus flavus]KDE80292.1 phosphoglycerate mutase family domain protein [Aspergillus oryzae 100-8]|eukprot:EIT76530.1 phosphoglycerate mutase family domain protein [Aspergillus oryzae 3.042]